MKLHYLALFHDKDGDPTTKFKDSVVDLYYKSYPPSASGCDPHVTTCQYDFEEMKKAVCDSARAGLRITNQFKEGLHGKHGKYKT